MRFVFIALFALAALCSAAEKKKVRIHNPSTLSKPTGYSHVVEVTEGKMVFIAGQVSFNAKGDLVGKDDFTAQTKQVFENLKLAVESAGGTFEDVVKLNVYIVDRVDRGKVPAFRQIRDEYVNTKTPPASTLVFIRDLARPDFLVEIEAVAVIGATAKR